MRTRSLRRIRGLALVFGSLACAAAVALAAVSSTTASRTASRTALSDREAVTQILRLGIDAHSAAIAGVSAQQFRTLIHGGIEYFRAEDAAIRAADAAVATTHDALEQLLRQAGSGRLGNASAQTIESARTQHRGAVANRDSLLNAAFAEITADLNPNQVAALHRIASNRDRQVPLEYRVLERSDSQWASLRAAMSARTARQQATALGLDSSAADADPALTAADTDPAVIAARTALANTAPLEAVLTEALQANR